MSIFKNNIVIGITAGLAASILAPFLIPAAKRSARPLAKALIKGGMAVYEKGREAVATTGEMIEDVVAEIHAEEGPHDHAWDDSEPQRSHSEMQHETVAEPQAGNPGGHPVRSGNGQSSDMQEGTA